MFTGKSMMQNEHTQTKNQHETSQSAQALSKIPNITYEKKDILLINYDKNQRHEVYIGSKKTHILTHFKTGSDKLIVFFNGAVDINKTPLPTFQRHSWLHKLPYSSIIVMDPTIDLLLNKKENNYITWYQGDEKEFFLEKFNIFIKDIINKLDILPDSVIFYGSSAGGFASIISATLLKNSKACVVNPQITISNYYKKYTNKIFDFLKISSKDNNQSRVNIINLIKKENNFPCIYYKQNSNDTLHYEEHYLPINNLYSNSNNNHRLISIITNDERGHTAIPLYNEALDDLIKTYELFSEHKSKHLTIKHFGITPNKSTIDIFKPRKDNSPYNLTYPIDWNIDPFNDRNWCFQLNSWRMMESNLFAFEKDKRIETIIPCLSIMKEWLIFFKNNDDNKFTWYDMSSGLRSLKVAYILHNINYHELQHDIGNQYQLMLNELAELHIEKLKNQPISNNNHGIFQIHGLLMLSRYIKSDENIKYSLNKLIILLENQFYNDGYHTENSDEYHWFISNSINIFGEIDICKNNKNLNNLIKLTEECKKWTVFPDLTSLSIGDSNFTKRNIKKSIEKNHNNENTYITKYFKDAGYYFIRSEFNTTKKDSSLLFLQTAFKNNTHRHADDFNILLYEHETNILVDAGKYSYEYNNEKRKLVVSTKAHNCLVIDNKNYSVKKEHYYNTRLVNHNESNGVYTLKTLIERKDINVCHSRHIVYKPKEFLIVIDEIHSNIKRDYTQWWHFHQDMDINHEDTHYSSTLHNKVNMSIKCSSFELDSITPIIKDNIKKTQIIKGQITPELQGWRSLSYRSLTPNFALSNNTKGTNCLLITEFSFNKKSEDLNLFIEYQESNKILMVQEKTNNNLIKIKTL